LWRSWEAGFSSGDDRGASSKVDGGTKTRDHQDPRLIPKIDHRGWISHQENKMSRVTNDAAELVPWQTPRKTTQLPTPTAEPEVSDAKSEEFNRWSLQQAEIARQSAIEAQIDPTLSAEEIRALYERELAAENAKNAEQRAYESARTFTAECGTYIQTPQNAKRIADWLEAAGLDGTSTDHYHKAYGELSAAGLLRVKPAPAQPRRAFSTADLYTMPLEDLKRLAEHDAEQTQTRIVGRR
jgi:hypothetical protein